MRGTYGITRGPDGALWFTNYLGSSIGRISVDGTVSSYTDPHIRYPVGITTGPDGALWFTDDSGSIGRITPAGVVRTYGDASTVGHPLAITLGRDGALWATDRGGSIVRITTGGSISRYADSTIRFPVGIAAGHDGALWFTNYTGDSIDRVRVGPAAPDEPAPRLTIGGGGKATAASVVRSGALETVRVEVRIDRRATLRFTVRNPRTGVQLRLQPGSRVAGTLLKQPAGALTASIPAARTFPVQAALATRGLTRGRVYELVLDAVGTTRKRSESKVSFRG
jgi:streptogramin lyase